MTVCSSEPDSPSWRVRGALRRGGESAGGRGGHLLQTTFWKLCSPASLPPGAGSGTGSSLSSLACPLAPKQTSTLQSTANWALLEAQRGPTTREELPRWDAALTCSAPTPATRAL